MIMAGTPQGKDMCQLKTKCFAKSLYQIRPSDSLFTSHNQTTLPLWPWKKTGGVFPGDVEPESCGLPQQLPVIVEAGYHVENRVIKLRTVRLQVPFLGSLLVPRTLVARLMSPRESRAFIILWEK